jgi:glucose-6-phosphate 1-dehydrogenase
MKTPTDGIKKQLSDFLKLCSYVSGQYDKDEDYKKLNKAVEEVESLDKQHKEKNRVFYMALPPSVFVPVAKGLKNNAYSTKGINRLIVEKPFGMDLESSRELGRALAPLWKEEEVIILIFLNFAMHNAELLNPI